VPQEEERALWKSVAKQVNRYAKPPCGETASRSAEPEALLRRNPPPCRGPLVPRRYLRPQNRNAALAADRARERSQLSRAQEIDARIDLHGMTQTRAHRTLLSFCNAHTATA